MVNFSSTWGHCICLSILNYCSWDTGMDRSLSINQIMTKSNREFQAVSKKLISFKYLKWTVLTFVKWRTLWGPHLQKTGPWRRPRWLPSLSQPSSTCAVDALDMQPLGMLLQETYWLDLVSMNLTGSLTLQMLALFSIWWEDIRYSSSSFFFSLTYYNNIFLFIYFLKG